MVAAGSTVETLADAADDQTDARRRAGRDDPGRLRPALSDVESALRGGAMLRGEVYARWRELVASGELRRAVRARAGPARGALAAGPSRPPPGRRLLPALARAIAALVAEADLTAARRCRDAWRGRPGRPGPARRRPDAGPPWPGFTDAAHDLVHDWSTRLRVSIRRQARPAHPDPVAGVGRHAAARHHRRRGPAGRRRDRRGRRSGPAAGDPGRRHVHALAEQARADLLGRIHDLFAVEVATPPRPVSALGRRRPRSPAADGRRATARRRPASGRARRRRRVTLDLVDRFDALETPGRAAWPARRAPRRDTWRPRRTGLAPGAARPGPASGPRGCACRGDHTVVALAGATGSGKSSLFNALARMELSPVSDLRPTTDAAHACVWGAEQPAPLLDWLGVDRWRRFLRESVLDAERETPLRGLVLLDLPDMDTVADVHRLEVDRLVGLVDLVVWVLDPQKYADQAVHDEYLRRMDPLREVTVVVFNQVDRLAPADAVPVPGRPRAAGGGRRARRRARARHLGRHRRGRRRPARPAGEDRRRSGAAAGAARGRAGDRARRCVAPLVGPDIGPDAVSREIVVELADRLSVAAGVTAVAADAERVYLQRAAVPGWRRGGPWRPSASRRPTVAVAVAVRRVAARVGAGLPTPWPDELRRAATADLDRLPEVLARRCRRGHARPVRWWRLARLVWWLAVLAARPVSAGRLVRAARADGTTPDLPDVGGVRVALPIFVGGERCPYISRLRRSSGCGAGLHQAADCTQADIDSLDVTMTGYKAHHNLALIYQDMNRLQEAEQQRPAAVADNKRFVQSWLGRRDLPKSGAGARMCRRSATAWMNWRRRRRRRCAFDQWA